VVSLPHLLDPSFVLQLVLKLQPSFLGLAREMLSLDSLLGRYLLLGLLNLTVHAMHALFELDALFLLESTQLIKLDAIFLSNVIGFIVQGLSPGFYLLMDSMTLDDGLGEGLLVVILFKSLVILLLLGDYHRAIHALLDNLLLLFIVTLFGISEFVFKLGKLLID
jgi:hypothetical protein